jgi:hypothetical protein
LIQAPHLRMRLVIGAALFFAVPHFTFANPFSAPGPEEQAARSIQSLESRLQALEMRSKASPQDLPPPLRATRANPSSPVPAKLPKGQEALPAAPLELGTLNGSTILLNKGVVYTSGGAL